MRSPPRTRKRPCTRRAPPAAAPAGAPRRPSAARRTESRRGSRRKSDHPQQQADQFLDRPAAGGDRIYGAILGGFLFAGLQTAGAVLLPALLPEVPSAYKDVFAFAAVIAFIAWRPTGLIAEKTAERV